MDQGVSSDMHVEPTWKQMRVAVVPDPMLGIIQWCSVGCCSTVGCHETLPRVLHCPVSVSKGKQSLLLLPGASTQAYLRQVMPAAAPHAPAAPAPVIHLFPAVHSAICKTGWGDMKLLFSVWLIPSLLPHSQGWQEGPQVHVVPVACMQVAGGEGVAVGATLSPSGAHQGQGGGRIWKKQEMM